MTTAETITEIPLEQLHDSPFNQRKIYLGRRRRARREHAPVRVVTSTVIGGNFEPYEEPLSDEDATEADEVAHMGPDPGEVVGSRAIATLRRRVARARNWPVNTCSASRHVEQIAEQLLRGQGIDPEEREHVAESLLSVVESLWKARTKLAAQARTGEP